MKLTVKKLGRIESAEIDVRPLTVFIGPNGTNKTWTAYALYGLLKRHSIAQATMTPRDLESPIQMQFVNVLRQKLAPIFEALSQEPPPVRVETVVGALFAPGVAGIDTRIDSKAIQRLLFLPDPVTAEMEARLEISPGEFAAPPTDVSLILQRPRNRLDLHVQYTPARASTKLIAQSTLNSDVWTEDLILRFVAEQMFRIFDNVLVFPAERKGLLVAMNSLNVQAEHNLLPAHADLIQFVRSALSMPAIAEESTHAELTRHLANILGGEVAVLGENGERRVAFKLPSGQTLPLVSASSLSRAAAGLSLYIKHFAEPNDVLIIDELEMNAHPEAQLALTELVAMLVNRGVRVIFTTHSPYVVEHINNLMEASKLPQDRREQVANKFQLKSAAAFLSPDRVSVHAFEETSPGGPVRVSDVMDRDAGLVDRTTFGPASRYVTNLFSELLEAGETGK